MKVEHHKCPHCDQVNKVNIPENFEDKVEGFLGSAPSAVAKSLGSLALGIFVNPVVGFIAAGSMLAASAYNDGTVKCAHCGERFRIR
jgi:hypothetical protein